MTSGGIKDNNCNYIPHDDDPEYLLWAYDQLGVKEGTISRPNKKVAKWIKDVSGEPGNPAQVPWCAYFVGAALEVNKYNSTKSGSARSYLKYGEPSEEFIGAICVFWRGKNDDGVTGHVGFLVDWDEEYLYILGGNQGDSVNIQKFSRDRLLKIVKPRLLRSSRTIKASVVGATSEGTNAALDWFTSVHKAVEEVQTPVDTIATYAPTIKVVLSVITIACILAAIYFRYEDHHKKGK